MLELKQAEQARWIVRWRMLEFLGDIPPDWESLGIRPSSILEGEGNLLLNEGINEMWLLITGGGGAAYSNANARLGVGNSAAAAVATQTALQGGSTSFKAMDSTYPVAGAQLMTFQSTWPTGDGNFAWDEWTLDNGSAGNKNMNRKVTAMGTKTSAVSRILQITVTLA